ncbi:MAG TPA: RND family transporter [Methanoculleus sp.]|nr:RND family transporter [Methanoculleus sp.]
MKPVFEQIARTINRHPYTVAGVFAAVFVLALFGTTMLSMETGTDTYLDKTTTRGALLAHYTNTYGSDAVMIIFEADDVTNPAVLAYIDMLEEDIRTERYIGSVNGIATLMKQANGGVLPASKADIYRIRASTPPEMLERYLPSQMMTISAITLEPGVSTDVQNQVLTNLRSLLRITDPPPGLSVTLSGSPAFQMEMMEEMQASMGTLIGAAMLLMVLAVLLLFSHVRSPLLPVAVVAVGLVLTFGFMGIFGIPISMTVIGAFPVLIGIGIDYAIQFHSRLDEAIRDADLGQAVTTAVAQTGPSVLIAMGATSMGFIAMLFAPIPMVADFGITCTIGVVCCYLAALVIVPTFALLTRYRPKQRRAGRSSSSLIDKYDTMLGRIAYVIAKHPLPVILVCGLIALTGLQLDARVPVNADEETFVPSDMPAMLDMKKVTRTMGSTSSIPVIVAAENVLDPATLAWLHDFGEYEMRDERVTGVASIATLLVQYNGGTVPATSAEVAAVMERIPQETRDRYLNGNTEAVMEFSTVNMNMEASRSFVEDMGRDLAWNKPPVGVTAHVTGQMEMFAAVMDDIRASKTTMTLTGFAFILGFLLLVYRKFRAVSPLIPIVFIVGWNGAIMYLFGLDYSPLTAVLGSMSIGVASEYTILIMERCEEELAQGLDLYEAIRVSVQKIGTAITVSGMTTVFGFSALLLSTFNIVSNFGLVTVITVAFSLTGAICIMPAVISLMYRAGGTASPRPAAGE